MRSIYKYLLDYLRGFESLEVISKPLAAIIVFLYDTNFGVVGLLSDQKKSSFNWLSELLKKTKTDWDDILVKHKVFAALAHLVPAFIMYYSFNFAAPVLHQELSELSDEVLKLLSADHYFTLGKILLKRCPCLFCLHYYNCSKSNIKCRK